MEDDGNLIIYDPSGEGHWTNNTAGHPNSQLVVQGDGDTVIYDSVGNTIWRTKHHTNQALESVQCCSCCLGPFPHVCNEDHIFYR